MNRRYSLFLKILICFLFTSPVTCTAQSVIKGTIKDAKGTPIEYVNVFIKNSTDGSITD